MKLTYKILWFEDQEMLSTKRRIINYLDDFGFDASIEKHENLDDYESTLKKSEEYFKDFDLILLDYHLEEDDFGNGQTTKVILNEIQKLEFCSEVIFYSNKPDFNSQITSEFNLFQGVFWYKGRDYLFEEKIKPVINLTLKKSQDINNLRGLLMAETADLDSIKKDILNEYFNSKCENKEKIKKKIITDLEKKLDKINQQLITLNEMKDSDFQDFFDKSDFFTKSINLHRIDNSEPKKFIHQNFDYEIIEPRNNLAHVIEEVLPDGKKILRGKKSKIEFSPEYCNEIRKKIREYKKILLEVKNKINSYD